MSSIELTKMAMAVLIAGIVAMVAGFIARGTVNPTPLQKNAFRGVTMPCSNAASATIILKVEPGAY